MVLSDQMVAALDACTARTGHPSEPSIRYLRHAHLAAVRRRRRRRVRRHRLCLGFPDLLPDVLRLSAWLGCQWHRATNRLRRLVGLKPRRVVHTVGAAGTVNLAGHISAVVSTSNVGSLEDKVEYLLRRD